MCFFKTPKPPKPPPVPTPPNPNEASAKAEDEARRKAVGAAASRNSTVITSSLGDPGGFGGSVDKPYATGTALG
jgi:hypothetical protein